MSIHEGHRERLRQRFLKEGLDGFDPLNVLELILFFSNKRSDTTDAAYNLMQRFGSFSAVLDAPYDTLCSVEGVGPQSAFLLKLVAAATKFYANDRLSRKAEITSSKAAGEYFLPKFVSSSGEEVYALLLDDKRQVIRCAKLFEGTVNAAPVTVKKVVSEAVISNATGVILAHNHPGGLPLPSGSDCQVTEQVFSALKLINVELLDHIIVAGGEYTSMADSGMMPAEQKGAN